MGLLARGKGRGWGGCGGCRAGSSLIGQGMVSYQVRQIEAELIWTCVTFHTRRNQSLLSPFALLCASYQLHRVLSNCGVSKNLRKQIPRKLMSVFCCIIFTSACQPVYVKTYLQFSATDLYEAA